MKHGLSRCGIQGEAIITTGLPVAYHLADKERLAQIIQNVARESGIEATVHVLPQPAGAFFSLLFDERGGILDARLASQRIGVLDIGYFTTDLITVDGLQVVDKQIASIESGVSTALEAIRRDITDKYHLNLDLYRTEEAVKRRKVSVFGEDQDISGIVSTRLRELEAEIEAQAQTIWGNGADLDRVHPGWRRRRDALSLPESLPACHCIARCSSSKCSRLPPVFREKGKGVISPRARKASKMAKMSVKVSLNSENPFEAKLIERLKNEKNMAGTIKVLAYERLVIQDLQGVVTTASKESVASESAPTELDDTSLSAENSLVDMEDINRKVDQMFT